MGDERLSVTTEHEWKQVTVVGCGLIGSSFALALKRSERCHRVLGWDTSASVLNEALALGVIDEVDGALAAGDVSASDLIYLSMPVLQIIEFLRECGSRIKPGAIITDAGSTKASICHAATDCLNENRHFIGGHPIAGSHESGVGRARAELFAGATYVLTTENSAPDSEAFNRVRKTIEGFGARVRLITAATHDHVLAFVSHLPQLLSSALATTVNERGDAAEILQFAGPAYADMSRLASSSWTMWRDVFVTNPGDIAAALDLVLEKLSAVRDELRRVDSDDNLEFSTARRLFEEN